MSRRSFVVLLLVAGLVSIVTVCPAHAAFGGEDIERALRNISTWMMSIGAIVGGIGVGIGALRMMAHDQEAWSSVIYVIKGAGILFLAGGIMKLVAGITGG